MKIDFKIKLLATYFLSLIIICHNARATYLVSIPPLHSILSGILKNVEGARVDVLLDGQLSPHTFALKPSHIQKIRQADVVFWIGPTYETFLIKPLETFSANNIKLVDLPDLALWPVRRDGHWQQTCCHHKHLADTSHSIAKPLIDAHIWLDVNNTIVMTEYFYNYFLKVYPNQQTLLKQNADRIINALKILNRQLIVELKDCQHHAFLVHHDGYQYFEKTYQLTGAGVIMNHPESSPSVHYVKNLLHNARSKHVRCIFSESQFNSRFIDELVRTLNCNTAVLDPFGYDRYHDERDYIAMMQGIAHNFTRCFKD